MNDSRSGGRRRTGRPPRVFDQSVPSPCIQVCTLDDDNVCIGCYRSADEIREWMIMDRPAKLEVLERVRARRRAAGDGR